jgi:hypothetical protein
MEQHHPWLTQQTVKPKASNLLNLLPHQLALSSSSSFQGSRVALVLQGLDWIRWTDLAKSPAHVRALKSRRNHGRWIYLIISTDTRTHKHRDRLTSQPLLAWDQRNCIIYWTLLLSRAEQRGVMATYLAVHVFSHFHPLLRCAHSCRRAVLYMVPSCWRTSFEELDTGRQGWKDGVPSTEW